MFETDSCRGLVALVTGASSGIGEATARALAEYGADVALAARRADRLESLADELESEFDVETCAIETDVTDHEQVTAMIDAAIDRYGRLDIVVSNAGVFRSGSVEELSPDAYRHMMAVNTDGQFYTARAALPSLRESSGTIVFVGSNAGVYPYRPNPVYGATKWWIRGFAHSLAASVSDDLSVSVVNPSTTYTEIGRQDGAPNRDQFEPEAVLASEDVATAVLYAVLQDHPNTVNEVNYFRQDEIGHC